MNAPLVSVVLVRENAEQMTGSGCCGKLEGDAGTLADCRQLFTQSRRDQLDLGLLHRAVREFFPVVEGREEVSIATVDPRNQLYLVAKLWHDVWRYRPGFTAGLRALLQLFSLPAVFVNGRLVSSRKQPVDPDQLCHLIALALRKGN